MRAALAVLRGLIFLKRHAGPVLKVVVLPFVFLGRVLVSTIGIPLYRGYFFLKCLSGRAFGMAERRLSFVVTNSRLVHAAVMILAAVVIGMNVTASDVRAETFGRQSILYALVSVDEGEALETETAAAFPQTFSSVYRPDASVGTPSSFAGFASDYAMTSASGAVLPLPGSGQPQVLIAPVPARSDMIDFQVAEGDTLGGIAARFGLNLNTVLWANNLTSRSTIRPGLVLHIPPEDGVLYTVKKGDTVGKIAASLAADATRVQEANHLASGATLAIGSQLFVPGGQPPAPPPPAKRPASIANLVFAPKPSSFAPIAVRGTATGVGTWVWPTDWRIITQYFSWRHNGLDIGASYATRSYAAADGTVIYTGWRTGYGMTVEVDHGGGLITRYAHNSKFYVNVGDAVLAGDVLAQSGSTGNSTGPHLHFEVIKNGKFQNPLDYIR